MMKMTKLLFSSITEQMLKSLLNDFKTPYWAISGEFNKYIPLKKAELIDEDGIKHTFEIIYKQEVLK